MTTKTTYTIQEVSKKYHLNASTLRYYEELGLLTNVQRTSNQKRIYTADHLNRLDAIMCFKRTSMPIIKIKEFFQYEQHLSENIDDIIHLVETHEQDIQTKLKELQSDLEHIQKKVRYFKALKNAYDQSLPFPNYDTI